MCGHLVSVRVGLCNANLFACLHVYSCSQVFLTNTSLLRLFQYSHSRTDISPAKVTGFALRYWVTNQSGPRIRPRYSYLSTCPPQISVTEVNMWSNGDHTHSTLAWLWATIFLIKHRLRPWRRINRDASHKLPEPKCDVFALLIFLD